ncbi:hypothetical protein J28TS4_24110 [Paenibacillus lautus]|nr:hypothetical protein J28TS4_24110 [Paenibacillus lautus]
MQAAVYFEPYVDRLDEMYQLDALVKLINVNLSLHRWNKIKDLAERLENKGLAQYKQLRNDFKNQEYPKQPIIFYILYAFLIQADVSREQEDYEKGLYYISLYSEPDWIQEPDAQERKIITQFKEWAEANRYSYQLMAGQAEVIIDYVEYVAKREDEIFLALCNIMIAANRYYIQIDHILERFQDYLVLQEQKSHLGKISKQVTLDRFTRLLAELAIYNFKREHFDRGIDYLLESLTYSIRINSVKGMLRCMGLFEQFRHVSSFEKQKQYKNLVSEVHKRNEKKIGLSVGYL